MFRKKKTEQPVQKNFNYTETEKDFAFLNAIMTRKKNITKEFLIGSYTTQQSERDYLKDEDIEVVVERVVTDVIKSIGDNYKNFLIEKYFGNGENLISYISEEVYVDLVDDSIKRNLKKLSNTLTKKATEVVQKLNKK